MNKKSDNSTSRKMGKNMRKNVLKFIYIVDKNTYIILKC